MLKVGVIGATGYTGEELLRILLRHPGVKITALSAKIDQAAPIAEICPRFRGLIDLECHLPDTRRMIANSDFIFLALPHRVSMEVAPEILAAGKKVVDLSADYRLKNPAVYEKWYGIKHRDAAGLGESVYGLPELKRKEIKKARLIANPGCYPTGIILALAPALRRGLVNPREIIGDAYSGVTGAGRHASLGLIFPEVSENLKAYKINRHQHQPEIEQELSAAAETEVKVIFAPHLAPVNRGILTTIYARMEKKMTGEEILSLYREFYSGEPFVRVCEPGKTPELKDVVGTNVCGLGLEVDAEKGWLIAVAAIDNLTKGAAGQAVQNMNIMQGFPETEGLLTG